MFLIFLMTMVTLFFFVKEPMQLLILVMLVMMLSIIKIFLLSLDYWTMFIMILSFLVGLFLMFVYMVSFSKKNMNFSTNVMNQKWNFFLITMFLLVFILFAENETSFFYMWNSSSFSWYEKWMQEKSEIMTFFVLAFFFLISLMFFSMKKTKKNMKSSI